MDAMIQRALSADYLDAVHFSNVNKSSRERFRRPVRLPPETWERVRVLKEKLSAAFPGRYITLNSTLEFVINEGLRETTTAA